MLMALVQILLASFKHWRRLQEREGFAHPEKMISSKTPLQTKQTHGRTTTTKQCMGQG